MATLVQERTEVTLSATVKAPSPATAAANAEAEKLAKRSRALVAVTSITDRWKNPTKGLFDLSQPMNSAVLDPAVFRVLAYDLTSEGAKNGMTVDGGPAIADETEQIFKALDGDADREPYLKAFAMALQAQSRDDAHLKALGTALDDLMHGGDVRWNTKDLLAHYAQLSNEGKKWIGKAPKTAAFRNYVLGGKCGEHGALEATHLVADKRKDANSIVAAQGGSNQRILSCQSVVNMFDHGALGVAVKDDEKKTDGATTGGATTGGATTEEGKPDPIETAATALIERIKTEIAKHSTVSHEEHTIYKKSLEKLIHEIETADEKVRDRLYARPALMEQLMKLAPGQMKQIVAKLDTVQGLFETLEQWAPEAPRGPGAGMQYDGQVRVPLDARVYPTIETYLTARPGKDMAPARMRVLQHEQLKARYIDNLVNETQRKNVYRLVANGTLEPTLVDDLRDAARAGDGGKAATALMKLGGESPDQIATLRDDHIFRKEIENVDKEVDQGGFKVNAYHLCLTFWGIEPLNTRDITVDERQQEANPDAKLGADGKPLYRPLTIEERMELETKLLDPYATKLRSEIHENVVDDADMRNICQSFEKASKDFIPMFRTLGKAPGPMLTEYYNNKYRGHDLRGEVDEYVSDSELVECNRILGYSVDSASVGIIAGKVAEHGAGKNDVINGKVKVGLAQALRETFDEKNVPYSQITADYAQQICNWLYEMHSYGLGGAYEICNPSVNKDELLDSWHKYRDRFTKPVKEAIAAITTLGPEQIHPIELLSNAVREKGGDLSAKIKKFYNERWGGAVKDQSAAILLDMGLRPEDEAERAKGANAELAANDPVKALEQQSKQKWAGPAAKLFESIAKLPSSLERSVVEPVAKSFKDIEKDKIDAAPHVEGPKTASIEERPPKTFIGFYRLEYGIEPRLHVSRVLKAHKDHGTDVTEAAGLFGVDAATKIEAVTGDDLKIKEGVNRHLVRYNFTEDTARSVAKQLWNGIHEGTRLNALVTKLYTDFSDEEQRLIRMGFRELSGGIDLQFYLQQRLLQKKSGELLGQSPGVTAIGAEGTETTRGEGFTKKTELDVAGDASELQTAVIAAKEGTVDNYAMMKSAATEGNVDGIMRLADEAEQGDRAKILQDHDLMGRIHSACDAVAYNRVYKTLTNQADLVDRLYQRGAGLGTDEKGMREDIKAHVKRLQKRFTKELQAKEEAKPKEQPRRSSEDIAKNAKEMVREECQRLMANISVRRIIEEELSADELSEVESLILNAGETTTQSDVLRAGKESDAIIAGIRNTDPKDRAKLRADPAYLEKLADRLRNPSDYREAMDALMSDRPGEDALSKVDEHATKDKSREMLRDLVDLSPTELKKLQADPELLAKLLATFEDPDKRALARKILTAKMPEPPAELKNIKPGDMTQEKALQLQQQADVERIAYLRQNAINRLLVPVVDKLGWDTMLSQCIEVYKMELEQRVTVLNEQNQPQLVTFSDQEKAGDRQQRENTAAVVRQQIWQEVSKKVAGWTIDTEKDKPRRTLSEVWTARKMFEVVQDAVLKKRDPSGERLLENMGATVDMPDVNGLPGQTHKVELDNDYDGIKKTINGASEQLLVNEWSNVSKKSASGGQSLAEVYAEYVQAKEAGKPHGELEPTVEARQKLEDKKLAFMNYTFDISTDFEQIVLPHVGPSDERKLTKDGGTGPLKDRDNKKYNELLDLARGRIVNLSKGDGRFLVARAIHIDPASPDFGLIDQQNRDSITSFTYRDSKYMRSRGTQAGSGWAADDEAKFLDQRMMQYGHDVAAVQTNDGKEGRGIITGAEGERVEEKGVEMERALQAFKDAKAKVAFWMSMIIGTLVTAILTVLTGGLATGPLAALFFTTAIAGVSAGAKALVNEAVLAEDYDLKDEGVKMIGKEMLTAFITAGTTMMAQKFLSSVSGVTKAARQARVLEQVGNNPPPIWRSFLHQASEEVLSEGMSGVIDAGIAAVDPVHWMHGMAEGRDRALPQMWEQLSNVPMQALKGGITSMITAGVMRIGKKKELQGVAHAAGHGGKVNVRENFKKVFGGNSERVIAVFVEWTVNNVGKQKIDLDAVPADLLEGFLQEVSETSVETHTETAHEASRSGRAQKDLDKYKDKISKNEHDGYLEMQSRAQATDPYISVGEYVRARQQMARDAVVSWSEKHPGEKLTIPQVMAFEKWVRDSKDATQLHERLATNPLTVKEVNDAKDAKTDTKTNAGTHVDTHNDKDGAAKEPPVVEVKTVASVEEGYALMRQLVGGDGSAVGHEGSSAKIEWGLGRKADGSIVLLKGKQGEVDFDHIPGIVALAHSHPAEMDGKPRDLAAVTKQPGGVAITDLMNDTNSNDLVKFLPSTGDLGYFADNTIGHHIVFTPYVHMGDGKIGNPNSEVAPGQRIEIVVNNSRQIGRSAIQKHQPAYSATIIIRTGDGQVLWTGPMFAVKIAGGTFRADQPSLAPNMIEQGVLPDPKPSDDTAKAEAGTQSDADMLAKYGTRKGDKKSADADKHAKHDAHVTEQAPGAVTPRSAADVFAGVTPVHGEVWTFKSASGNFYTGRFQGVDATGHIVVETSEGVGRLDPMRLDSGRRGPSAPQLHQFGPHDRVKLVGKHDHGRTGTIQGYDGAGNIIFKTDSGETQTIPLGELKLDQTRLAPEHHAPDHHAKQQQQSEQEQAAQQQAQQQAVQQLPQYAPQQQPVARTATEVFAGQQPQQGQLWTFESVSGNFYQGRYQGVDAQGRILVATREGVATLEPQRLVTARVGASVHALQGFGPTDRITLYSVNNNARTGVILGYDEQGNILFKNDQGVIEGLRPEAIDLTRTERAQATQPKPTQDPTRPVQTQPDQQSQQHHSPTDAVQQVATNQQTPTAVERNIQRDLPTLNHLSSLPDHVIGAHQASRVPAALRALSDADYQHFRSLHDSLQSSTAKGYLLKALAAHNSMTDLQWLASEMSSKDDAWLADALTLGDPRGVGVGVQQQWSMSCNASTTITLRGNYDPVFALRLRQANPGISQVDPNNPMAWNQHLAELEAGLLQTPYQGASHPHLAGEAGIATPHAAGATKGRWADDILSRQQDVTGMAFATHKNPQPEQVIGTIDRAVSQGMQVPIVIGDTAGAHTHYVLVMSRRQSASGGFEYSIHNTGDGTTTWVSAQQLRDGQLPLNGGRMVTAMEVPHATPHPDQQQQQQQVVDPTNPQQQGQAPTARPDSVTRPMAAVTVEDAPAIASTAVAVVSEQLPQSSLASRLQPSGDTSTAAKGEQKSAAQVATVPQPVANAVQMIVHGRAFNAAQQLQAMEAKAAAATQQQSGQKQPGTQHDADYQDFTNTWKNAPADLKAFREFFDVGYEDAVDKVRRAMQDPQVAALLAHVPEDELAAIVLYTQTYFTEMNDALRKRDRGEGMKDFGDAIKLADKGLSKLPVHEGWVHRGIDSLPADVLAKYVPGVVVTEEAFTSSSQVETGAFKGKVKFNILSKSGRDVRQLSRVEAEKEVLFRPGTKFIVVDKVRDGDATVITMEEVTDAPGGHGGSGGPGGPGGVQTTLAPDQKKMIADRVKPEAGEYAGETVDHSFQTQEQSDIERWQTHGLEETATDPDVDKLPASEKNDRAKQQSASVRQWLGDPQFRHWYDVWMSMPDRVVVDAKGEAKVTLPPGVPAGFGKQLEQIGKHGNVGLMTRALDLTHRIEAEFPGLDPDPNSAAWKEARPRLVQMLGEEQVRKYESERRPEHLSAEKRKLQNERIDELVRTEDVERIQELCPGAEIIVTGSGGQIDKDTSDVMDLDLIIVVPKQTPPNARIELEHALQSIKVRGGDGATRAIDAKVMTDEQYMGFAMLPTAAGRTPMTNIRIDDHKQGEVPGTGKSGGDLHNHVMGVPGTQYFINKVGGGSATRTLEKLADDIRDPDLWKDPSKPPITPVVKAQLDKALADIMSARGLSMSPDLIEARARRALDAIFAANEDTPFDHTYDIRDIAISKHIDTNGKFENYAKDVITELHDQGVTYSEQSVSMSKLEKRFTPEVMDAAHRRAQEDGKDSKMEFLVMAPTHDTLAGKEQKAPDAVSAENDRLKKLLMRSDVKGMDVAGPESKPFTDTGMGWFVEKYKMLSEVAKAKGEPMVLRPHVGEGYDPNHSGEHVEVAQANLQMLIKTLQDLGYNGSGDVIVRFGHATHATPEMLRQMASLGIIVEANIGSNLATGSVLHANDHPLLANMYFGVKTVLATDAQGVMGTTLSAEYARAAALIQKFREGQPLEIEGKKIYFRDLSAAEKRRFSVEWLQQQLSDYKTQAGEMDGGDDRGPRHASEDHSRMAAGPIKGFTGDAVEATAFHRGELAADLAENVAKAASILGDGYTRQGNSVVIVVNGQPLTVDFIVPTEGDIGTDVARHNFKDVNTPVTVTVSPGAQRTDVARAIAHELAEIQALMRGVRLGSDRDAALKKGSKSMDMTAHDFGRAAELKVLSRELSEAIDRGDDARREQIEKQIAALREHLGLDEASIRPGPQGDRARLLLGADTLGLIEAQVGRIRLSVRPDLSKLELGDVQSVRDTISTIVADLKTQAAGPINERDPSQVEARERLLRAAAALERKKAGPVGPEEIVTIGRQYNIEGLQSLEQLKVKGHEYDSMIHRALTDVGTQLRSTPVGAVEPMSIQGVIASARAPYDAAHNRALETGKRASFEFRGRHLEVDTDGYVFVPGAATNGENYAPNDRSVEKLKNVAGRLNAGDSSLSDADVAFFLAATVVETRRNNAAEATNWLVFAEGGSNVFKKMPMTQGGTSSKPRNRSLDADRSGASWSEGEVSDRETQMFKDWFLAQPEHNGQTLQQYIEEMQKSLGGTPDANREIEAELRKKLLDFINSHQG